MRKFARETDMLFGNGALTVVSHSAASPVGVKATEPSFLSKSLRLACCIILFYYLRVPS